MVRLLALPTGLALALSIPSAAPATAADNTTPTNTPAAQSGDRPTYKISVGLDGEIYPAFANYASLQDPDTRSWGAVAVTIANPTRAALRERVAVQVRGWSDEEIQMVELAAGTTRTYLFAPSFLARFYNNQEIAAATVRVKITDPAGRLLLERTAPARLRSADDMYWGDKFRYAEFIASWVTPHAPEVERILARAKEYMPGRRLPGYESWKNEALQKRSTLAQMNAIYRAVQAAGVSYVKSSNTFGDHEGWSERVRLPGQSLRHASANCIDGVVLYASLFENLGMEPEVVLVPGHAYLAVRAAQSSDQYIFLETSLTGRARFARALQAGAAGIARYPGAEVVRVKIAEARAAGIYPMPGESSPLAPPSKATSAAASRLH